MTVLTSRTDHFLMLKHLLIATPVSLDALNRVISTPDPMTSASLPQASQTLLVPTLHTIEEVAARLRVSTRTVRRRIKDGTILVLPLGGRLVRISSNELRRLISRPTIEP